MSNLNLLVGLPLDAVILRSRRGSAGPKDLNRGVSGVHCAITSCGRHLSAALISAVALFCFLFAGCAPPRPSTHYQLPPPSSTAADAPTANVYPVTILVGPLTSSH